MPGRRNSGFALSSGQSAQDGDRFELLISGQYGLQQTGRFGVVLSILQDGDADVKMDDGLPPHIVKWRQIWRL
jgi:hypothetical protein